MTTCSFSIVIPTYNSSRTIEVLCNEIFAKEPDAEVIIVDDNSPDHTGLIAEAIAASHAMVKVVPRASKLGVGSAVYDGVLHATSEMVVVMDSDLHHRVSDLPRMIELLQGGYDVVIASRYMKGSQFVCSSVGRRLVNRAGNSIARLLLGAKVQDWTHGFRGYRRTAFLACFEKSYVDGTFNLVVLANAYKQGYRIAEIPCHTVHQGKSNAQLAFRYLKTAALIAARRVGDRLHRTVVK